MVRALAATAEGLWIGTYEGLVRLQRGQWKVFTPQNSKLPNPRVEALAATAEGLWIGTYEGLAHRQLEQDEGLAHSQREKWEVFTPQNSKLPHSVVLALAATAEGLWIGTAGGLAHLQQGQWEVFTPQNSKLPHSVVLALAATAEGLWIGTAEGLVVSQVDCEGYRRCSFVRAS